MLRRNKSFLSESVINAKSLADIEKEKNLDKAKQIAIDLITTSRTAANKKAVLMYDIKTAKSHPYLLKIMWNTLLSGEKLGSMSTMAKKLRTESVSDLSVLKNHIARLTPLLKLSSPEEVRYKNGSGIVPNQLKVTTKRDMQLVFDKLRELGYYKTRGLDSNPDTWTKSRDIESMSMKTDPLFLKTKSGLISVFVQVEHGGNLELVFTDHGK